MIAERQNPIELFQRARQKRGREKHSSQKRHHRPVEIIDVPNFGEPKREANHTHGKQKRDRNGPRNRQGKEYPVPTSADINRDSTPYHCPSGQCPEENQEHERHDLEPHFSPCARLEVRHRPHEVRQNPSGLNLLRHRRKRVPHKEPVEYPRNEIVSDECAFGVPA